MHRAISEVLDWIPQNAREGRRTLMLCFYAGRGATKNSQTCALFNSNDRDDNEFGLEFGLGFCAKEKGAYVINLFACGR